MKKLISKIALVAFALAMVPTADAAGVVITASADGARQVITMVMPAGLALTNADADDITLQLTTTADGNAVALNANQITAITAGVNDEFAQTVANRGDANGYIVVTDIAADFDGGSNIVFTLTNPLADNTAYTVSYRDTNSNYGAAMFNTGISNQVAVTATVEPVLTMALSETDLALGILPTAVDTYSSDTVNVTTGTNATSGVVVTMTSAGLADTVIDREIGETSINAATDTAATDYYKVQSNNNDNVATPANITDANGANAYAAAGIDMAATQQIANRSVAHSNYVTTVTIAARADIATEAGDYSDTLTFTATATF